jgi:tRNA-binding protein
MAFSHEVSLAASFQQFNRLNMLVGKASKVEKNKSAKIPAYLIELSFGEQLNHAHKMAFNKECFKSSAQLCSNHTSDDIQGNLLISVVNFPRKQIGPIKSDCLVTGAQNERLNGEQKRDTTVFLRPTKEVAPGSRVGVTGESKMVEQIDRDLEWNEFLLIELRIGTIVTSVFKELEGQLGQLSGTVCLSEDGQNQPFFGLVSSNFLIDMKKHQQLLFWTNPASQEIAENCSVENLEPGCVLLCTLDAGRVGIEPAKQVSNGFRIA